MNNLFSSNKKDVTRTAKKGKETTKTISCRLHFIESSRSMVISLWNLVNNFQEGFIKLNVKMDMKI